MDRSAQGYSSRPTYLGPGKVLQKTPTNTYVIQDSDGKLLPRNLPPNRLKRISADDIPELSFVVEAILDHRGPANKSEYLVRWKGCDPTADSWEPPSHFDDHDVIKRYWERRNELSRRGRGK